MGLFYKIRTLGHDLKRVTYQCVHAKKKKKEFQQNDCCIIYRYCINSAYIKYNYALKMYIHYIYIYILQFTRV